MSELGQKIRELRKAKKITLVELAKITGVAQASLSRIETGIMAGTVDSHRKISEALGSSIAELYEGLDTRHANIIASEPSQEKITILANNVTQELLTSGISKKKIVPTLYTLAPGTQTNTENLERNVERFLWIVEGELTVMIDENEYTLKKGHSIYFDASLPHFLKNTSSENTQAFCATSPAQL